MTHEINEHRFLLFRGSWILTSCKVFNFMGHEISKVAVFEIFMIHEIHFQGFFKFLMVHKNHLLTFHVKIMTSKPTMKIWISVFMGIKYRFMGFSKGCHGVFIIKWFIVIPCLTLAASGSLSNVPRWTHSAKVAMFTLAPVHQTFTRSLPWFNIYTCVALLLALCFFSQMACL